MLVFFSSISHITWIWFRRLCYALFLVFLFALCSPTLAWSSTVTVRPTELAPYNTAISSGGVNDINDNNDGTWMTVLPGGGAGDNGEICGIDSFSDPGITDKQIEEIKIFFRYDTDTEYSGQTYAYVRYSTAEPTGFTDSGWFNTTIPPTVAQTTTTTVSDTIDKSIVGWDELPNLDVAFMNSDADPGGNVRIYDIWIQITYDDTPPAGITNLSALPGTNGGDIDLSWTAPGDDGWEVIISSGTYRIKYSTYSAYSWSYTDYDITISTSNVHPGDNQYHTVTGLDEGTTYYFRIWTADEVDNWSDLSNGATGWAQREAPAEITNLSALTGFTGGEIDLSWSAPGDDGWSGILGTIDRKAEFRIQYTSVITQAENPNWWNKTNAQVVISTYSVNPGDIQYYTVGELEQGATYYFRIWTADEAGTWSEISNGATSWAQVTPDITPPGAINNLSAIPGTWGGEIDLSWTAPGDDGYTGDITDGEYRIQYSTSSTPPGGWSKDNYDIKWSTNTVQGQDQYRLIKDLTEAVTYYFRIWTRDEVADNWSLISNGAAAWAQDIRPAAITNLSALPGEIDQKINLTWSAPGDDWNTGVLTGEYIIDYATYSKTWNPANYEISIPTSNVNPGDGQYRAVLDLAAGATYYFRIWTRDEVPNHWSEISNGATTWAPAIAPAAVTDLEALPGAIEGSINLTWTAPAEDGTMGGAVSSYILKYATFSVNDAGGDTTVWWNHPQTLTGLDGGSPKEPGETETFITRGLSPGKRYYFALKSKDDVGSISAIDAKTASSNQANAVAASIAPAAITDLVATSGIGYDRIDLSWTAPGDDGWQGMATKYIIKYATYEINAGNFETVTDVKERSVTVSGGNSDSETITGLMAYTLYYFAIKTEDELANVSGISNIASFKTGKDNLPPREPVGVRAVLIADGETMSVSWRAVTKNEDETSCTDLKGYNIYRAQVVDGEYLPVGFVAEGQSLVWIDSENISGRTFYYMVRAKDTSENLSRTSMIVDSSVDMNIIAFNSEDGSSRIVIPKEISQILYKETNSYGEDIVMEVLKDKEQESERLIRSFIFLARGGQSGKEIKDFIFDRPLARIVLAYEVENGYVKAISSIPENLASEQLALFWFNGLEWIKLGGEVDQYLHLVSTRSKRIGKYMLKISFRGSSFGIESIQPDKIFTPNRDGWNDYLEIHYTNPKDAFVNGKIYDVRGALVTEMEKRANEETLIWDGKDTNGNAVPGGVYIYQIQVVGPENKVINGTVVVAR